MKLDAELRREKANQFFFCSAFDLRFGGVAFFFFCSAFDLRFGGVAFFFFDDVVDCCFGGVLGAGFTFLFFGVFACSFFASFF